MRLVYYILILIFGLQIYHAQILNGCHFAKTFYKNHPNIFQLNTNQTSLTVRPLYSLSNHSFTHINQSLSIGIIYRFANIHLVPVPLVFECPDNEQIHAPSDCEFTITDIRVRQ